MGEQLPCACPNPDWVRHDGWWRCKNCLGVLPYMTKEDAWVYMRICIAEGRAALAREQRERR